MRPRPTKPISPSGDRRAAVDFGVPDCSRAESSDASLTASGALGSCLDIGTPDLPQPRSNDFRGGHIHGSGDERCLRLSQLAVPYQLFAWFFSRHNRTDARLKVMSASDKIEFT